MSTPAGWFPDPEDAAQLRYWDGQAWTAHRAPAVPSGPTEPTEPTEPTDQAPAYPSYPQYPQDPQYSQYPQYPAYPQDPAAGPYAPGPYAPPPSDSNTLSIIGIVCGAIAFLFVPPLFGIAGLVLGGVGKSRNERLAPWALGVSAAGLVIGMILGAIVWNSQT